MMADSQAASNKNIQYSHTESEINQQANKTITSNMERQNIHKHVLNLWRGDLNSAAVSLLRYFFQPGI
jgi:hypothetical protein